MGCFAKFWLQWLCLGALVFGGAAAPADAVGVAPVDVCRGHRPSQRLPALDLFRAHRYFLEATVFLWATGGNT